MRRITSALGLALVITFIGHPLTDSVTRAQQWTGAWRIQVTNLTPAQSFTPLPGGHAYVRRYGLQHRHGRLARVAGARRERQRHATGGAAREHVVGDDGRDRFRADVGRARRPSCMWTSSNLHRYVSLAAMLIPTNDTFVGARVELPATPAVRTVYAYAYDAGTEVNDETCASIPGPNYPGMRWTR